MNFGAKPKKEYLFSLENGSDVLKKVRILY